MEQSMAVSTPNQVNVVDPVKPVIPDISLDPMDFQKEIQKIASEQGMKIENGNVVPKQEVPIGQEQSAPEAVSQPQQAETQLKVPEKFQTQNGQIDLEKVQKSAINAEEALRRYQEQEAELRRQMNTVRDLKTQVQTQPPQTQMQQAPVVPQQSQVPQLTPEIINDALTKTQNPGRVLLDLLAVRDQAVYHQARTDIMAEIEPVRQRVENAQRKVELEDIYKKDQWVFSEEGIKTLSQIRINKPWLNNAPEPWREAYRDYLADKEMGRTASQASTNQPVKAPPTPINGGNRTQTPSPSLASLANDPAALNRFLDSLPDEKARSSFWRSVLPGAK